MAIDTNLAYSLGAGSGVDTKKLASSLVEAERAPRQQVIDAKIKESEAKISGLGAMSMIFNGMKAEFEKLNQTTDFNNFATFNSAETAFSVTTTSTAVPANHSVEVVTLASPQRTKSSGFALTTTALNGGSTFSIAVSQNGGAAVSLRIPSSVTTPAGLVDTINSASVGFTATLLNTGDSSGSPYRIVLAGVEGAVNSFAVTSDDATGSGAAREITFGAATATGSISVAGVAVAVTAGDTADAVALKVQTAMAADPYITNVIGRSVSVNAGVLTLGFAASDGAPPATVISVASTGVTTSTVQSVAPVAGASVSGVSFTTNLQTASDARVRVDGLDVYRSTNTISDVIPGVTLDLRTATSSAATLTINRDSAPIKEKLNSLITTYNAAISDFAVLMGDKNFDDETDIYSGSLAGDSTARIMLGKLKSMVSQTSDSASNGINAMRDIGVDLARDGSLSLNETTFNAAMSDKFSDVVKMLTADSATQSLTGTALRGVAGASVKSINDLLKSGNDMLAQSANAEQRISGYEADLVALGVRMDALLSRYTKQFSVMDMIVGQINSTRDGLTSQFEALSNMYKN
ncbi:MAG: flagellar filament capping protein FliD [Burkholderiaceae bacterium]|jgi:flagellar hook-associated protein 2